ncbi:pyroglutamyl-peptidase I [Microbacterium hominis]|uniref:Pyroglutamyl-peptidase I n=1 Tax=Microbacterium hominis TaxID=162426 RepID=A0A7D4UJR6_9MICO|nr:pyroglutamyl-peptidase I [Microbacterium hominis]QKJ19867.1 pyroglutamyl-peptidase I [Microbacterium hominis]
MTTVLLTGFEPFGGDAANPSGEAVHRVAAGWSGPETLVTAVLPVAFSAAAERLRALIAEHSPDAVVATGLAGGRAAIGVERVAVNLLDARIPDNDGQQPIDVPSVPGAPAAAFATLPVKAIVRDLRAAGIPAELSYSAGTYVCNHVFFSALHAVDPGVRTGFVHVPWSAEHAPDSDAATLPLAQIARAIDLVLRTTLDVDVDAALSGGTLH